MRLEAESAVLAARQHIERSLVGMRWKGQPLTGASNRESKQDSDGDTPAELEPVT